MARLGGGGRPCSLSEALGSVRDVWSMAEHFLPSCCLPPAAGSQTPNGEAVGFETEAYAILDTLAYIRPDFYTLVRPRYICLSVKRVGIGEWFVTCCGPGPACTFWCAVLVFLPWFQNQPHLDQPGALMKGACASGASGGLQRAACRGEHGGEHGASAGDAVAVEGGCSAAVPLWAAHHTGTPRTAAVPCRPLEHIVPNPFVSPCGCPSSPTAGDWAGLWQCCDDPGGGEEGLPLRAAPLPHHDLPAPPEPVSQGQQHPAPW